ncbi:phosphoribosylglycinamide formyltransferase [Anaerofustis stercorihominis]|uniref:phosphoribosylglycinamide formyltransferase n=1 Tax=Anaerofustis stercorihominis TaxID=214853 RepID=UPI00214AC0AC|nr:phosphoribosylglycinamide formyltransferase [Anaerofustis stercorihominis]MCR2033037.1 phosphoribosylglycinamide formyltransferase [Anaerofustis stercorihominis]
MSLKKIAVLISGGGSNLQAVIDKVHKKDGIIDVVISDEDDAYGLTRAKNADIDTLVINNKSYPTREEFADKIKEELLNRNIDLIVLAGFMKILPPSFAKTFKNKIINVHPSLIPSFCGKGYYGIKVHEAVLNYGAKITGATVHFADEGADTGPIIIQGTVPVFTEDTPEILQKRVLEVEHMILPKAVSLFCLDKLVVKGRIVYIKE